MFCHSLSYLSLLVWRKNLIFPLDEFLEQLSSIFSSITGFTIVLTASILKEGTIADNDPCGSGSIEQALLSVRLKYFKQIYPKLDGVSN